MCVGINTSEIGASGASRAPPTLTLRLCIKQFFKPRIFMEIGYGHTENTESRRDEIEV